MNQTMNLNLSVTLFLALVAGATATKHESSTEAKVQPVELINYRTVLKGGLPKPVFLDMDNDDDKKKDKDDKKNDKDDDDDKNNKDDDNDTLFLALAGATAIKHESSTEAKVQPVELINYRTVLKGGLRLQDKLVFLDMDNDDKKNNNNDDKKNDNNDDKKNDNNDDKNDKDDDDDKNNKDDDDKENRSGSVPECKTNGVNYHKCYPATMKPSDEDTCDSIENDVCGKDMSNSDKDYCKCMGFNGKAVVTTAGFFPVRKGSGSSNHKQLFIDLDSDDGGKTNHENKKTTDDGTGDNKNNVDND
ncbi:hypothetical protein HJC23_006582, partial [Cyclotella cryptica]